MSASSKSTRRLASAIMPPKLAASVVLPTPPLVTHTVNTTIFHIRGYVVVNPHQDRPIEVPAVICSEQITDKAQLSHVR